MNTNAVHPPERNPVTYRRHRWEVFWQITLPLVSGGGLVLAGAVGVVWAAARGTGDLARWMSISLIWLIAPALVVTLFFLIILIAVAYGVGRGLQVLPPYAKRVQNAFTTLYRRIHRLTDVTVEPVLWVRSWKAGLGALLRRAERM